MLKIISYYERFHIWLGYVCGAIAGIMGVTIVYNVIMRYIFRDPTFWSYELNQNLLVLFAGMSGAYVLIVGGHVRVDILYSRYSPKVRAVIDTITFTLALIFIFYLVKTTMAMTANVIEHKAISLDTGWSLAPSHIVLVTGGVFLGLEMVFHIIKDIHFLLTGSSTERSGAVEPSGQEECS